MAYKCCICKQIIDDQDSKVPYKSKFAHLSCFNEEIKKIADVKKITQAQKQAERNKRSRRKDVLDVIVVKETVTPKTETEAQDEKHFREFVYELTGDKPKAHHIALAKKYVKDYKVMYKDIVMALRYWFLVTNHEVDGGTNFIGVFPYAYEQAKQYYNEIEYAQEENKKIDMNKLYKETIIHISKPVQRFTTQINMSLVGI